MKYTKGKWELQRPYIDRPIVIVAGKQRGKRGVIAEIYQAREQLANAQLIAKAPYHFERCKKLEKINADLYEACKAQLKWSQEIGYPGMLIAKEALAKAKEEKC